MCFASYSIATTQADFRRFGSSMTSWLRMITSRLPVRSDARLRIIVSRRYVTGQTKIEKFSLHLTLMKHLSSIEFSALQTSNRSSSVANFRKAISTRIHSEHRFFPIRPEYPSEQRAPTVLPEMKPHGADHFVCRPNRLTPVAPTQANRNYTWKFDRIAYKRRSKIEWQFRRLES